MVWAVFNVAGSLTASQEFGLVGLNDLQVAQTGGGTVLFAAGRGGGWLTGYDVGAAGQTVEAGYWSIAEQFLQLETTDLVLRSGPAGPELYMAGLKNGALRGVDIDNDGQGPLFEGNIAVSGNGHDLSLVTEMELVAGSDAGIAALRTGGLVNVSFGAGGDLAVTHINEGTEMSGERASDLVTATHNGQTFAFASYGSEDTVGMFRQDGAGNFQHIVDVDVTNGLWVDRPGAVTVSGAGDGGLYVVVAASGTDSLSVLSVAANGTTMGVVDHVLDTLDTRFANVTHVESFTMDGRDFILAAGSDAGLSLFSMLPGGRLHHEHSFEATAQAPLNGLSALEVLVEPGGVRIWAATEAAPYLSEITLSLDNIGVTTKAAQAGGTTGGTVLDDVLVGGGGADLLSGGAGNDILMDGQGQDSLRGGAGSDVFIFNRDDDRDTVLDFQLGLDRIDLSGFGAIGGAFNVTILTRSWGAEFRVGDDVIDVRTENGSALSTNDFGTHNLVTTGRLETDPSLYPEPGTTGSTTPPVTPPSDGTGTETDVSLSGLAPGGLAAVAEGQFSFAPAPHAIMGTNANNVFFTQTANDHVHALAGQDTVNSAGGNDVVNAGNGNDVVSAGAGNDLVHGSAGFDTVWGGEGRDTVLGGNYADSLIGQGGDDVLQGNDGFDRLFGHSGDDSIWGGMDADVVFGGHGDDWISGDGNAVGWDRLYGEGGQDRILGGNGNDMIFGGAGDDTLDGGLGVEYIYGQDGNDVIVGAGGFDRLWGNAGNDRIYGGNGTDVINGNTDNDTVWGGLDNDTLYGEGGDDILDGGHGADLLHGGNGEDTVISGAGNDVVYGNGGGDLFVFHTNHGHDSVMDYNHTNPLEKIDLSALPAFTDFDDLMSVATQVGNDVRISTGPDSSLRLVNVDLDTLRDNDFLF